MKYPKEIRLTEVWAAPKPVLVTCYKTLELSQLQLLILSTSGNSASCLLSAAPHSLPLVRSICFLWSNLVSQFETSMVYLMQWTCRRFLSCPAILSTAKAHMCLRELQMRLCFLEVAAIAPLYHAPKLRIQRTNTLLFTSLSTLSHHTEYI
jgi:hypothetical protein